ncbi:MAG: mannose-6-phosphate isomerase, class I, partial [Propionibacterium sp.]|nr:mannose-6-phosphate isomerase, class I [Propionibacterium sp.]
MRGLTGTVQHFVWGDRTEIPRILGIEPDGEPWAEYWLGAHASGPSSFDDAPGETLASYLSANPHLIGERSVDQFGAKLPYMMKLLSAAGPLSLQVHTTRDQAVEGYAKETLMEIPFDDPARSYKD